jgi:hypothetical protein
MGATFVSAEVNQELYGCRPHENSIDNEQRQGLDSRNADRDYDRIP